MVDTLRMFNRLPEVEPPDIDQPDNTVDAERGEILQDPPQHQGTRARDNTTNPSQSRVKNRGKAQATRAHIQRAQASDRATSPEIWAQSAPVD